MLFIEIIKFLESEKFWAVLKNVLNWSIEFPTGDPFIVPHIMLSEDLKGT